MNLRKEFGLAAIAFKQSPGRPFVKPPGPKTEFLKSALGGFGPIVFSQRIRLGEYSLGTIPWATLCKIAWPQSRIYEVGAWRRWADKLLRRTRLGGCKF